MNAKTGERVLQIAERKLREAVLIADGPTQRALERSVTKAVATIEEVCPAVLQPTPNGMMTAYGPTAELAAFDRILLVATATRGLVVGLTGGLPSYDRFYPRASGSVFWGAIHQFIRRSDPDPIAAAVFHRIGEEGLRLLDERMAPIKALGALPLIVALAARGRKRHEYCGLIAAVALPPSIDVQLATQEAATEAKH